MPNEDPDKGGELGGDYARDSHRGGYGDDYARDGGWSGGGRAGDTVNEQDVPDAEVVENGESPGKASE